MRKAQSTSQGPFKMGKWKPKLIGPWRKKKKAKEAWPSFVRKVPSKPRQTLDQDTLELLELGRGSLRSAE